MLLTSLKLSFCGKERRQVDKNDAEGQEEDDDGDKQDEQEESNSNSDHDLPVRHMNTHRSSNSCSISTI